MSSSKPLTQTNQNTHHPLLWHLVALFIVVVWGSTLASTKVLLASMSPAQIMLYRAIMAYGLLWVMSPRFRTWHSLHTELLYIGAGLCGITLYFLTENTALIYTYSSNVALLVTASPLFTVLIASFVLKTHAFNQRVFWACIMALVGVALVIYSQAPKHPHQSVTTNFGNDLLGNGLAIVSGLVWAFFGFLMAKMNDGLNPIVRMRKIFFYGIVTTAIYMGLVGEAFVNVKALQSVNLANLGFLGGIASALCFVLWNRANHYLGVVKTSLYIYFIPLVAVILGVVWLGEPVTLMTLIGGVMIAGAVFLANFKRQ
ncbi:MULTISPECIES: DMT family transporter [unclassified Moraxella]|uniref:DMT family transporter n=1 Tax=unclassified Moraxella TaxID=2685852 RepID=UPI003AF57B86